MTDRITADKPCLPPYPQRQESELLTALLRDVSRSFYLTLRVLPEAIRPQVSLAYLLARASDTIADTQAVAKVERIEMLQQMCEAIGNPSVGATFLSRLQAMGRSRQECRSYAEAALLDRLDQCLSMLYIVSESDQKRISELLQTIITGQIFDLEKFPGESEKELVALADDKELDRYTYMVAGCVGEFWTRMCQAHLKELEGWDGAAMEQLGVRFGKGLQLVNVLRDLPKDLRIGRCYLPVKEPRALLDPQNFAKMQPLYDRWLDTAVEHLRAGWKYTMQIPPNLWRLRLACGWPIWIGLKTIARLREANPLDPSQRIQVSRMEVYGVMCGSFLWRRNDAALDKKAQRLFTAAS